MVSPGYIPGPLVIPLTFQMRLNWVLSNGRNVTNVLHAIVDPGLVNSLVLANAVFDSITADADTAPYFAFLASNVGLESVDIRDLRTPGQSLIQSEGAAIDGTGSGNPLPEEVALVVSLRTALSGRAHRGRIYLAGFDTTCVDSNGHAVAGLTAAAQAWVTALRFLMSGHGMPMGIGHRGHAAYTNARGATVDAEVAGTDLVTSASVRDNVFDSQRRRK